jgi:hypothetical protein
MFYDLFNEKVEEFFRDLIVAFPHIQEFKKFKSGLTMLKNVDPKGPEHIFKAYVLNKYKDALLNKDESVFLNEEQYEVYSSRKEHWLEFIDHLKTIWRTLDNDNKEVIWNYFHVLLVLSEKCG